MRRYVLNGRREKLRVVHAHRQNGRWELKIQAELITRDWLIALVSEDKLVRMFSVNPASVPGTIEVYGTDAITPMLVGR